jgi:hypothetical protein
LSTLIARAGRLGARPPGAGNPESGHDESDTAADAMVEDGVVAGPVDLVPAVSAKATPATPRTTTVDTRATSHALVRELRAEGGARWRPRSRSRGVPVSVSSVIFLPGGFAPAQHPAASPGRRSRPGDQPAVPHGSRSAPPPHPRSAMKRLSPAAACPWDSSDGPGLQSNRASEASFLGQPGRGKEDRRAVGAALRAGRNRS